jgi:hypothetical protein
MQLVSSRAAGITLLILSLAQQSVALQPDDVREQLVGNFRYLIESQVDCDSELGPSGHICNKDIPGERRINGSWDSYMYPVAVRIPYRFRFVDSNIFFTVQTLLPLFSVGFDDPVLEQQRLDAIHAAMMAVNSFRRGDGYAFWPEIGPTRATHVNRIGPLNVSPLLLGTQIEIVSRIQDFFHVRLFPSKVRWLETFLDLGNEATGADVLFNVPNDTDDTALAIAGNFHYYQNGGDAELLQEYLQLSKHFAGRVDTLESRNRHRYKNHIPGCEETWRAQSSDAARQALFTDRSFLENCSLDDARESWRYDSYPSKHSGAFLTWQYDESEAIYEDPESGVVLPGQNSVDCYAIANVVYSLSLTGMRDDPELRPGYESSCNVISNTILDTNDQLWKSCGLFFPAHMTYPYLVSRAVGDGGACQDLEPRDQERFDKSIGALVERIIAEQDEESDEKKRGQWFESTDGQTAMPTVLGGVSLLNFRRAYGADFDQQYRVRDRVETAIAHTIASSDSHPLAGNLPLVSVPEGTYFGGGTSDEIAHWRSRPFATAVSLELMTKYLAQYVDEPTHNAATDHLPVRHPHVQDSLPPVEERSFRFRLRPGLKVGNEGTEVTAALSLSVGDHFRGNIQEAMEDIVYYDFKVTATTGFDLDNGELENYSFAAGFHGISTTTSVIMQNDAAFLPLSFARQDDVLTRSAYLWRGEMSAPVLRLDSSPRINLDVTGKLIGVTEKSFEIAGSTDKVRSVNFSEFSVGLTWLWEDLSASLAYASSLGRAVDSNGGHYFSLKNHRLSTNITYRPRPNHSFALIGVRTKDGESRDLFDDDQVYLQYQYEWTSGR